METILAFAIGALAASGVWLLLRPRTFQVLLGLGLLSHAVNLFILSAGRLGGTRPPIIGPVLDGGPGGIAAYADPTPQALVLTAIVISFATTALLLVVILAVRGLAGSDHVDAGSDTPDSSRREPPR